MNYHGELESAGCDKAIAQGKWHISIGVGAGPAGPVLAGPLFFCQG